ncbi:hypothetical protein GN958_ATG11672 [Phytophthora infestans]|uniref:Bzip transcription factor n=1 Tax=Phytophthora infestans TaxID=4787 RepID=A0A8S9UJK7_PHYIN|nr:hypothetical protein GN958_ATG11672 [Phytophthora infestans]
MSAGSLYPPNRQSLSDEIVGAVVLRTKAASSRVLYGASMPPSSKSNAGRATVEAPAVSSTTRRAREKSTPLSGSKHPRSLSETTTSIEAAADIQDADQRSYVAKLTRVVQDHERVLALHRERRRRNQVRYRMKQRELVLSLGEGVRKIEREIQELEVRRHNASIGIPTHQTLWTIATEYFLLFRHGFRSPPEALRTAALNFLRVSMASNVVNGRQCGVESILAKWRLFSDYFDDVYVEVERLEKSATGRGHYYQRYRF